jgi:hypothetical protein
MIQWKLINPVYYMRQTHFMLCKIYWRLKYCKIHCFCFIIYVSQKTMQTRNIVIFSKPYEILSMKYLWPSTINKQNIFFKFYYLTLIGHEIAENLSWWSVLLVEEKQVPGENHQPAASRWQTLSHNIVSSTPGLSEVRTRNFSGE